MISVVIATYNGEQYIVEQLKSITYQTLLPDEIIIVDDCSSDETVNLINDFAKQSKVPVKTYINDKNIGSNKSFERAITLASGDIIFFSDQDDFWVQNKVELFMKEFENNSVVLVFSDGIICDSSLKDLNITNWQKIHITPARVKLLQSDDAFLILSHKNFVTGAAMAVRRKIAMAALPICENNWHDEWITLVGMTLGNIKALPDKLFYYRQHEKQQVGVLKAAVKRNIFSKEYLADHFYQQKRVGKITRKIKKLESLLSYVAQKPDVKPAPLSLIEDCRSFYLTRLNSFHKSRLTRSFVLFKLLFKGAYNRWCSRPFEEFFYDFLANKR